MRYDVSAWALFALQHPLDWRVKQFSWFYQQFYGNWHEISRIEHDFQRSSDCVTLDFEKLLTGISLIHMESQLVSNETDLNRNGIAFFTRPADNQGEFRVVWEADQGIIQSIYQDLH